MDKCVLNRAHYSLSKEDIVTNPSAMPYYNSKPFDDKNILVNNPLLYIID